MSNFAPPIHSSQVQGIVNGLSQRITDLEQMLHTASKDDHGSRTIMRGPEADITKAINVAQQVMAEERAAQDMKLSQAIAELLQRQNDFQNELRQSIDQFQNMIRDSVRDSVRQFLVDAQVIDETGKAHPSIKGQKGDKGDALVGPKGDKGDKGDSIVGPAGKDSTVPGPAGLDKSQIIEIIEQMKARGGLSLSFAAPDGTDVDVLKKFVVELITQMKNRGAFISLGNEEVRKLILQVLKEQGLVS